MTRVKICGITNPTDLEAALDAGADYIGIVREPTSKRYVENPTELIQLAAGRAPVICVFGPYISDDFIQLCDSIQTISGVNLPNLLRTFRIGETPVENIVTSSSGPILLDSFDEGSFGGTGEVGDWDLASEVVSKVEHPVFLAGGLTPDNVRDAIAKVRPFAVDVSSGVESSPGKKDHGAIRAFIEAARSV